MGPLTFADIVVGSALGFMFGKTVVDLIDAVFDRLLRREARK